MNLFRTRDKPADWVIDSVIQYICSPVFSTPVLDFIEERCVVFDSSEENKFSYTDAHQDFGKLIDYQLGTFMDDTGINPNDFASALALDISSHEGVDRNALKKAFKLIEGVDNFLLFKNIMVSTNEELNSRALEMLERSGMLTPQMNSRQSRFSDTPPPPYCSFEAEDGVRQLVSDDEVETFVRNLSGNLQEFDASVREQQEAIRHNIGIELENTLSQLDQLDFTEITNKPIPKPRLYPDLEYSLNSPNEPATTEEPESITPTRTMDNTTATNPLSADVNILIDLCTMDAIVTGTSGDQESTELDQDNSGLIEQGNLTPTSVENKFKLPELPLQQQRHTDISPGRDREVVNEEANSLGISLAERAQSPVEAADSLTQQWMEYAKEQKTIWQYSKEEKVKPSERDLVDREDYFKRQRDLLRKQRKQQRVTEGTTATPIPQHIPIASDDNTAPVNAEKERAKAEEAKKFRRALSAKLKMEVVNRHKD